MRSFLPSFLSDDTLRVLQAESVRVRGEKEEGGLPVAAGASERKQSDQSKKKNGEGDVESAFVRKTKGQESACVRMFAREKACE